MQQYFAKNERLDLEKEDYHHILNVMRMKRKDLVRIVYGGEVYLCEIRELGNPVKFRVINKINSKNEDVNVSVAFSIIKEQKLDYLLQKASEVGALEFIPVITRRTVVKTDENKMSSKIIRWQKICKEAAEQSWQTRIPKVCNVTNLKSLTTMDYDVKLVCSLNENTQNIKKVIQNINKYDKILIVIGPEGGFEKDEEKLLIENGFISVSLGKNVLRAETAPVVAISMINYEFMR